jgi:hypothetical protein
VPLLGTDDDFPLRNNYATFSGRSLQTRRRSSKTIPLSQLFLKVPSSSPSSVSSKRLVPDFENPRKAPSPPCLEKSCIEHLSIPLPSPSLSSRQSQLLTPSARIYPHRRTLIDQLNSNSQRLTKFTARQYSRFRKSMQRNKLSFCNGCD